MCGTVSSLFVLGYVILLLRMPPEQMLGLGIAAALIFVPTTPNPTTGFLLVLPESKVVKLDMSVADGIKYIVSLGAVPPENASGVQAAFKAQAARMLADG